MKKLLTHLNNHFIFYTLFISIVVIITISFFRFSIKMDYMAGYEGACDPKIQKCFVGCEDEECSKEYFYSKIQKSAHSLFAQCGENITDCESANECLIGEEDCFITYCEEEKDGPVCDIINEKEDTNL